MSYLKKLRIQGFRSFGPDDGDGQSMHFEYSEGGRRNDDGDDGEELDSKIWPLTLILGHNGCGKTTIIECLRYLTTGDTPPGSYSGKSFVHDPKVANEHTVRGSVKLLFRGTDGKDYMVTRAMEATQKPKQITVKTLDGTFTRQGPEGKVSLSTKCADINTMVLNYMGVSKAILNYVIFCHQEDSNWPLEEGSKVKGKFDEIFASDKYQNCLKNIKEVRSKYMGDLKELRKDIEYLKSDKKLAAQKKKELESKQHNIRDLQEQIKEALKELDPISKQLNEIREIETNYTGIIQRKQEAKTRLEETRKHRIDLENGLEFRCDDMDDDELKEMKRGMERQAEDDKKMEKRMENELAEQKGQLQEDMKSISATLAKIAACKTKKEIQDKQKKDLDAKVNEVGNQIGLMDRQAVSGDDDEMEKVVKNAGKAVQNAENETRRINQEMDAKIEEKARELGEIVKDIDVSKEMIQKNRVELTDNKKEIAIIIKKLRDTQASLDRVREIQDLCKDKEEKLARVRDAVDLVNLRKDVAEKKKQIKELEDMEKSLREERSLLDSRQHELTDMRLKEEDKKAKRKLLDRLRTKTLSNLETVFESAEAVPSLGCLKDEFSKAKEAILRRQQTLQEETSRIIHDSDAKTTEKKEKKKSIQEKKKAVEDFDEQIREAVGASESDSEKNSQKTLERALKDAKEEIEEAREELSRKEANRFTYEEFIRKLDHMLEKKSGTACPTCNRAFEEEAEARDLRTDLRDMVNKIPNRVKTIKEKIASGEKKQERFLQLYSKAPHYEEMRTEVKNMQEKLIKVEQSLRDNERDLSAKEADLELVEAKATACEDLQEPVLAMAALHSQLQDLEAKLDDLRDRCEGALEGVRAPEDLRKVEEETAEKLKGVRARVDAEQQRELKTEREVNRLERELNELKQEKLEIKKKQQEGSNLENKKCELEKAVNTLNQDQKELDDKVQSREEDKEEYMKQKNKLSAEKTAKLEKAGKTCDGIKKVQGELHSLVDAIRQYNRSDNDRLYQDEMDNLEEHKARKGMTDKEIQRLEVGLGNRRKSISEHDKRMRDVDTNIKLRKLKEQEKEFKAQVKKQEEQLQLLDYSSIEKKKSSLEEKYDAINTKRVASKGRLDEMKGTAAYLERELSSDKLRLAGKKFQEAFLSHRCVHHVISDLEKYHKALSYAITKFHQERMNVINRIVRELWRQTYRGNDIDYIEIKTDEVDPNAGIDKRRNCNYKVVMKKGNAELEMRGRCSAGQKVLASLIIRLALAETFSANCGIIALDEPTTNLDRENIASLSDALSTLVKKKRTGAGAFQLIVITHDEDLIDMLGRQVDEQRHYYRVGRNERGLSKIRKRVLTELG